MARSDGSVIIDTRLNTAGFGKGVNSIKSQFTKMGVAASKVGGTITSVFTRGTKSAKGFNSQLNSVGAMAKKVGGLIAAAFSVRAVVNFAKEALELGSDLQEVQNVVDVTFTTMSERVNEFAKNAASTAGLSETMAKRYAGTFGAMAKSFQFTEEEAFNMSTSLAQLSGDVASFYNITQDAAYTKLKSVFTGETETLKDLGVVMTQTALDDFALRKGIGKTTSQMTEQEKVALRYQFVMEQLSAASGDFIRTQDGWANQTRILSLQFEQLKATIGQGLINALTPAIKTLNMLIAKLQEAAESFKDFTEAIFGSAGDASGAIGGITDSTEDLGDAMEEAGKQAKKALAPFDEIVKIGAEADAETPAVTVPGTDGTVSGGTVTPDIEVGDVGQTLIDQIAESIKNGNWAHIGELINNGLINSLNGINWDELAEKVYDGARRVADALNGLMLSPDSFAALGTSIAGVANTIAAALQGLADGVDWGKIEEGFSAGMLSFSVEIDTSAIVDSVTDLISGAVSTIDFSVVGTSVANALNDAIEESDWSKVGSTIAQVLLATPETVVSLIQGLNWDAAGKAVSDTLNSALVSATAWVRETDWLKIGQSVTAFVENTDWGGIASNFFTLLSEAFSAIDFTSIGTNIGTALNDVMADVNWNDVGATIGAALMAWPDILVGFIQQTDWEKVGTSLSELIIGALDYITQWIATTDFLAIGQSVQTFIEATDWSGIANSLHGLFTAAVEALDLANLGKSIIDNLNFVIENAEWGTVGTTVANLFNDVLGALDYALVEFDWNGLTSGFVSELNAFVNGSDWALLGKTVSDGALTILSGFRTAISDFDWIGLGDGIAESINEINWVGIIADLTGAVSDTLVAALDLLIGFVEGVDWAKLGSDIWNSIIELITNIDWAGIISRAFELLGSAVAALKSFQVTFWANVATSLADAFVGAWGYFQSFIDKEGGNIGAGILAAIGNAFANIVNWIKKNLWEPFKKGFETTFSGTGNALKSIFAGIPDVIKSPINTIIGFINSMVSAVCSGINKMVEAINAISVEIPDWSWLPKDIRGTKIGFDIKKVTAPKIPYLAQGTVIPPNAPFMAVLGDQRHGTNIEAPLETIEQALENVLARRSSGMNDSQVIELLQAILEAILGIEIDGETLNNAITSYQRKMAVSTGGNA